MMQILAPTGSEGPLADGEKAFLHSDPPSARRELFVPGCRWKVQRVHLTGY